MRFAASRCALLAMKGLSDERVERDPRARPPAPDPGADPGGDGFVFDRGGAGIPLSPRGADDGDQCLCGSVYRRLRLGRAVVYRGRYRTLSPVAGKDT